jgi:hypothetical protein
MGIILRTVVLIGITAAWYNRLMAGVTAMNSLRGHSTAITGCIFAMLPCCGPACLGGLPIGIWALTVLNKPEIKNAFRS